MQKRKYEYIYIYIYILIIFSSFCSATLPGNFHSLLQSFYSVLTQLFSMVGHSIYPSAVIAQTILNNTRHLTLSLSRHPFLSLSLSPHSFVLLFQLLLHSRSLCLFCILVSFDSIYFIFFFFHFFFFSGRGRRARKFAHTLARDFFFPTFVRLSSFLSFLFFFFLFSFHFIFLATIYCAPITWLSELSHRLRVFVFRDR